MNINTIVAIIPNPTLNYFQSFSFVHFTQVIGSLILWPVGQNGTYLERKLHPSSFWWVSILAFFDCIQTAGTSIPIYNSKDIHLNNTVSKVR